MNAFAQKRGISRLLRGFRLLAVASGILSVAAALNSCKSGDEVGSGSAAADPKQVLISQGHTAYQAVCTACHNSNPKLSGTLGPEIWGSSLPLLKARVLSASYPEGYKPKRATHVMQPLPQVEKSLPAIEAYLNQPN